MIGYSSFGSPDLPWGEKLPHLLVDPELKKLADKHGKSTALVILRWQVQRRVALIPKVTRSKVNCHLMKRSKEL